MLVKLWREEPRLGYYLLAARSRHLPSSGYVCGSPFADTQVSLVTAAEAQHLSPFSDSACWRHVSGFEVPYNLSESYSKKPNSDLRVLYSVILKMLQGYPAFLPPLSFFYY